VLTSPGRRRATGPFHSRPYRLVGQSERVGMKGATRSTVPDDVSTAANGSERSAQRGPDGRTRRGFQAVGGGCASLSCGGFHAVCGGCRERSGRCTHTYSDDSSA